MFSDKNWTIFYQMDHCEGGSEHKIHIFFIKLNIDLETDEKKSTLILCMHLHTMYRECVSMGAAGAQTHRSLGHHLLHPKTLRIFKVLLATGDFEDQSSLL